MAPDEPLKIGELARRLELNVRTLRYYEQIGLLPPPERTEGGYRLYGREHEALLRFVLRAKRIGFTLAEIREMVRRSRQGAPCAYVRQTLREHREALETRIAELQRLRSELAALEWSWQEPARPAPAAVCSLIEGAFQPSPVTEPATGKEKKMARKVEVFTAGCPLCEPVVEMVQRIACDQCDVTIHSLNEADGARRAREAGVERVPMVLVDGAPAECCRTGPVTEAGLRAAGVGAG
jgi:DNA-binding transcriptional MerR regulator